MTTLTLDTLSLHLFLSAGGSEEKSSDKQSRFILTDLTDYFQVRDQIVLFTWMLAEVVGFIYGLPEWRVLVV